MQLTPSAGVRAELCPTECDKNRTRVLRDPMKQAHAVTRRQRALREPDVRLAPESGQMADPTC
jgi:hypothetical protein